MEIGRVLRLIEIEMSRREEQKVIIKLKGMGEHEIREYKRKVLQEIEGLPRWK
jgi:hypothetical protein